MRGLIIVIILVCITFVVAIETAFPVLTMGSLYRNYGRHKNLSLVLKIKKNISGSTGALLLYDNLFAVLFATFCTDFFSEKLGLGFKPYISLLIPFLVTLWEAIVKAYVIQDAARVSILLAPTAFILFFIVKPISYVIEKIARFFVKYLSKNKQADTESAASLMEVRGAVEFHHSIFPSEESAMVKNIMSLNIKTIEQIMVHHRDFEQIELKKISDILKVVSEAKHHQLVVWENKHDNVIGTITKADILSVVAKSFSKDEREIISILKSKVLAPNFIPETATIISLLKNFRIKGSGMYIVINEYTAVRGLVKPQDVLTSIVGEFDNFEKIYMKKIGKGITVHASTTITELNRVMFWNIPDEYSNVADFVLAALKQFPERGMEGQFDSIFFRVLECHANKIEIVYLELIP